MAVFEFARRQAAFADHQPVRDAEQFGIGEFDAWPRIPVIEQNLETGGDQLRVQCVGRFAQLVGALQVDSDQHHVERRQRSGPYDAVLVVILLDSGANDARNADAIAAHGHYLVFAIGILNRRTHGGAVFVSELKDVPDFDTACDAEGALATGHRVAGNDIANIGRFRSLEVATEVGTRVMVVGLIGTADEVAHGGRCMVIDDRDRKPDRTRITGFRAADLAYDFRACHRERGGNAGNFLRFYRVDLMVAAQCERDWPVRTLNDQGLQRLFWRNVQERAQRLD